MKTKFFSPLKSLTLILLVICLFVLVTAVIHQAQFLIASVGWHGMASVGWHGMASVGWHGRASVGWHEMASVGWHG